MTEASSPALERAIVRAQHSAYRSTFLVLGMKNRVFAEIVQRILPDGARRIADRADALS